MDQVQSRTGGEGEDLKEDRWIKSRVELEGGPNEA